jgi:hypothetical protein
MYQCKSCGYTVSETEAKKISVFLCPECNGDLKKINEPDNNLIFVNPSSNDVKIEEQFFKGLNGNLIITNEGVIINRGIKGFLFQNFTVRGDKLIPWDSIIAVQFQKASLFLGNGYLQLSIKGGNEDKQGLNNAIFDENTITWTNLKMSENNRIFEAAANIIMARISRSSDLKTCPECAEDVKNGAKICRFCGYKFIELQ